MRAVRLDPTGRKNRMAPLEKPTDPRLHAARWNFKTIGFNYFEFKMSDSYSEDYSESKEYPVCLT